jgi:hypothetical protein
MTYSSILADKSVLHIAAEFSHQELVQFFVNYGLPMDAKDANVSRRWKALLLMEVHSTGLRA